MSDIDKYLKDLEANVEAYAFDLKNRGLTLAASVMRKAMEAIKLLAGQNAALKEENERLMRLHADTCIKAGDEITTLKARVAELEKERQTLADAAYSAIIAFNNLQDESLDGEARAHALLKHTDCIRNLWNIFAMQDNARFKEPANEG